VQVGNAAIGYYEWTDSGNIDKTNDQLYRKLIDSRSRVLINKNIVGLSVFNESTARLTVTYTQRTTTTVPATSGEYTLSNNPWVETIV
jgi:hypothetical protein